MTMLSNIDWSEVGAALDAKGFAQVSGVLPLDVCQRLIAGYTDSGYRKTVVMARHRYGLGEYRYFDYPLPNVVENLRQAVYPHLVPVANRWMQQLNIAREFPPTLDALLAQCRAQGQCKATPLILKYGQGGFNTLHQDIYGDVYFPLQVVFMLNNPRTDFGGGEFVLTQQTPRAQSAARVFNLGLGDMLIFATRFRPVKSARGFSRSPMKHGVSEVHWGHRHTLGVIFHDALS